MTDQKLHRPEAGFKIWSVRFSCILGTERQHNCVSEATMNSSCSNSRKTLKCRRLTNKHFTLNTASILKPYLAGI